MSTRKIHLRLARLPSGLASYPRVVLTRRPDPLAPHDAPLRLAARTRVRDWRALAAQGLGLDTVRSAITTATTTPSSSRSTSPSRAESRTSARSSPSG